MWRVVTVLFVPALLGFAPIPPCRPMTDPDRAIQQLDSHACSTDTPSKAALTDNKRRLIDRLEKQHARLLGQGEAAEAAAIRDYLALVKSVDADRPLGPVKPAALLRKASGDGKYRHLLHVLYVPSDRTLYSHFLDFGYWDGAFYGGQNNLGLGHWVYIHPRWFVWKEGPPQAPQTPAP